MRAISATIVGNLTRAPSIRRPKEARVATLVVAVNYWHHKEQQEETVFVRCDVWEYTDKWKHILDKIELWSKGDRVVLTGFSYHVDEWVDSSGEDQVTHYFKNDIDSTADAVISR